MKTFRLMAVGSVPLLTTGIALAQSQNMMNGGMGGDWMEKPDAEMLLRYQALFALMQSLVEGKPVAAPAKQSQ